MPLARFRDRVSTRETAAKAGADIRGEVLLTLAQLRLATPRQLKTLPLPRQGHAAEGTLSTAGPASPGRARQTISARTPRGRWWSCRIRAGDLAYWTGSRAVG
ncbi:hypothetical protein ACWGDX_00885 [Streptomyces sp. NPDC055025]